MDLGSVPCLSGSGTEAAFAGGVLGGGAVVTVGGTDRGVFGNWRKHRRWSFRRWNSQRWGHFRRWSSRRWRPTYKRDSSGKDSKNWRTHRRSSFRRWKFVGRKHLSWNYRMRRYPSNWGDIAGRVRRRDGYRCRRCSRTDLPLHVDHVWPLSRGGPNFQWNLRTLCEDCHTRRHPHMMRRVSILNHLMRWLARRKVRRLSF